ncbi:DUF5813 family protein [Halapricum hydrolyticum]|uniref:DUF5813 family protein n=1 Tax=Halapricum hydrolyticum TaxID=2979991 RepID=A0AAE3I8M5_9EURY|nr:DUF5813 family protein [Halapricum hydrolyticum]MCU4716667.1 DUF5813 family protein [Halapricum hydrolyticum]MCU4725728.1 DUF5813 family protein [Halapricum hydrolyticum]
MTRELPDAVRDAFETHDGYEVTDEHARVTTTVFDGRVTVEGAEADWNRRYVVTVEVPTLSAVVEEVVGPAVEDGWFETLERRLEDAPMATRANLELDAFEVQRDDQQVEVTYAFTTGSESQAADVAKTLVEYVEGTYVEGIIPGYDYRPPVAGLLNQAQSGSAQGDRGGTPL